MGYNPLPEGENIKFLNMPVEVNQRLQEIWNVIEGTSNKFSASFTEEDWIQNENIYYIVFQHNLNSEYVIVQVYDENKKQVIMEEIQVIDENNVRVVSTEKFNGFIVVWG